MDIEKRKAKQKRDYENRKRKLANADEATREKYIKQRRLICKKWYHTKGKETAKERARNYRERSPAIYAQTRFRDIIKNAEKRKLDMTITFEEYEKLGKEVCYLCGTPPKEGLLYGLDRVDNDKGYIPDNVQPCCFTCNGMKSKRTLQDFLTQCKLIAEHNKLT